MPHRRAGRAYRAGVRALRARATTANLAARAVACAMRGAVPGAHAQKAGSTWLRNASSPTRLLGAMGTLAAAATDAHAQALPTPRELASGLDLECYRTPGPALNINLNLTHLNPVLVNLGLPAHQVWVRELVQTCVPVRKNGVWPDPDALPFLRHIDFACYRLDAAPLPNPVPARPHAPEPGAGEPAAAQRLARAPRRSSASRSRRTTSRRPRRSSPSSSTSISSATRSMRIHTRRSVSGSPS